MRLGWRIPLGGPFYLGGTVWRSKPRRRGPVWHGELEGWTCKHDRRREDTALKCAREEQARRRRAKGR